MSSTSFSAQYHQQPTYEHITWSSMEYEALAWHRLNSNKLPSIFPCNPTLEFFLRNWPSFAYEGIRLYPAGLLDPNARNIFTQFRKFRCKQAARKNSGWANCQKRFSTRAGHFILRITSLFGLRCPPHAIFKLKSDIKILFYMHILCTYTSYHAKQ